MSSAKQLEDLMAEERRLRKLLGSDSSHSEKRLKSSDKSDSASHSRSDRSDHHLSTREHRRKRPGRSERRGSSSDSDSESSDGASGSDEEDRKHRRRERSKDHGHSRRRHRRDRDRRRSGSRSDGSAAESESDLDEAAANADVKKNAVVEKPIDLTDFFKMNAEFRVWLLRSKSKYFDELSTARSRKYYLKFCKLYNRKKLADSFYTGIRSSELDMRTRTRHKWAFASKLDSVALESVRDSIDTDTYKKWEELPKEFRQRKGPQSESVGPRVMNPALPGAVSMIEQSDASRQIYQNRQQSRRANFDQENRGQQRFDRKRWNEEEKETLEEIAPRPDPGSFEARMQKRQQVRAFSGRKDDVQDELEDRDIFGGDNIRARLDSQRMRKESQNEDLDRRRQEYEEREKRKMQMFTTSVALSDRFSSAGKQILQ